jgi:hypothetical protein
MQFLARYKQTVSNLQTNSLLASCKNNIPYFSIDKAHLMYNANPKLFDIPFDV